MLTALLHEPARQRAAPTLAQLDLNDREQASPSLQPSHMDGPFRPARLAIETLRGDQENLTHWLAIDHGD